MSPLIHGHVSPGFAPVAQAFERLHAEGLELGSAFAVVQDGVLVADLWGGHADREATRPWAADTLAPIFSTTKPIAALTFARILETAGLPQGFETPIAEVWPEFAANGKAAYTLAELLSHQAGLPGFPDPIDPDLWLDPPALAAALAPLSPMWPRGEGSGYHPLTWGYLVGELARRLDPRGRTLGTVLREEITHAPGHEPLDVWIGLPDAEHERVAEIRRPTAVPDFGELNAETRAAFLTRWAAPNRGGAIWKRIEIPSANAHARARDLARLYGVFADGLDAAGRPILRHQATREALLRTRVSGPDRVLPFPVEFACGVYRNRFGVYGPSTAAFGHAGWGGSMGMGDPTTGISCAYIMNRQSNHLHADPRPNALLAALYSCEPVRERL